MSVPRRGFCLVAGSAAVLGAVSTVATAEDHLRLVSVDLPETIEVGGTFTARITIRNVGDERVSTEIQYRFEGNLVASMEITLDPGEERTGVLPDMNHAWLEQDHGATPGTYTHGIGVPGGPGESAEVEIVDGEGTPPEEGTVTEEPERTRPGEPPEGLKLVQPRLPRTLERGDPVFVGAVVENVRSSAMTIDITYRFEERLVFEREGVRIAAGEQREIGFPELTVSAIEESVGEGIPPGTYNHSFGMPDGPRIQEAVEIAGGSGGAESTSSFEAGDDPSETDGSDPPDSERPGDTDDRRQRGFISNSGDEPEFLSNPFNLTTLGFLLSVLGIAHQMLRGA